jgi:hypothetical protein
MKTTRMMLVLACVWGACSVAHAQERIYRCPGNEYTNNAADAAAKGCKVVEGGNITVVEMPKAVSAPAAPRGAGAGASRPSAAGSPGPVASAEQRERDSDSRQILSGELRKSEERLAELKRELGNGEPEKRGDEFRNHQKYLDRVSDLKQNIGRTERDIEGLKRELSRMGGSSSGGAGPVTAPVR